jgi:hypothetical protein
MACQEQRLGQGQCKNPQQKQEMTGGFGPAVDNMGLKLVDALKKHPLSNGCT